MTGRVRRPPCLHQPVYCSTRAWPTRGFLQVPSDVHGTGMSSTQQNARPTVMCGIVRGGPKPYARRISRTFRIEGLHRHEGMIHPHAGRPPGHGTSRGRNPDDDFYKTGSPYRCGATRRRVDLRTPVFSFNTIPRLGGGVSSSSSSSGRTSGRQGIPLLTRAQVST